MQFLLLVVGITQILLIQAFRYGVNYCYAWFIALWFNLWFNLLYIQEEVNKYVFYTYVSLSYFSSLANVSQNFSLSISICLCTSIISIIGKGYISFGDAIPSVFQYFLSQQKVILREPLGIITGTLRNLMYNKSWRVWIWCHSFICFCSHFSLY